MLCCTESGISNSTRNKHVQSFPNKTMCFLEALSALIAIGAVTTYHKGSPNKIQSNSIADVA